MNIWDDKFVFIASTYAYSDTIVSLSMASVQKAFLEEELLRASEYSRYFWILEYILAKINVNDFFFSSSSSPDVCWHTGSSLCTSHYLTFINFFKLCIVAIAFVLHTD